MCGWGGGGIWRRPYAIKVNGGLEEMRQVTPCAIGNTDNESSTRFQYKKNLVCEREQFIIRKCTRTSSSEPRQSIGDIQEQLDSPEHNKSNALSKAKSIE